MLMTRSFTAVYLRLHKPLQIFSIHADKTKLMFFTSSRTAKRVVAEKIVTKDSQEIELVSSFKYLGFLLDDSLSLREHI